MLESFLLVAHEGQGNATEVVLLIAICPPNLVKSSLNLHITSRSTILLVRRNFVSDLRSEFLGNIKIHLIVLQFWFFHGKV